MNGLLQSNLLCKQNCKLVYNFPLSNIIWTLKNIRRLFFRNLMGVFIHHYLEIKFYTYIFLYSGGFLDQSRNGPLYCISINKILSNKDAIPEKI